MRLRAERLGLSEAPVALACETNLANILATLEPRAAARSRRRRFDPDAVGRRARGGARHRQPGARRDAVADPLRQDGRQRPAARRPRHQGRPDRRPQGDRAHGRHRALFRRRPRAHLSASCARSRTASAPPTRSACSRWCATACARSPTRPSCSSATAQASSPGAAVFAGIEGTRPLLVEIQALVAPSALGTPRRAVVGWDTNRLSMLLAVLEARAAASRSPSTTSISTSPAACKITEPAADLAAAAALLSSLSGVAIPRRPGLLRRGQAVGRRQRRAAHGHRA